MTLPIEPGDDLEQSVLRLVGRTEQLNSQLEGIRSQLRKRTVAFFVAIAVFIVVLGLAVNAAYQVSLDNRSAIKINNAKFCPLIGILLPSPGGPQPSTPRGVEMTHAAQRVADDPTFGCR
jgi:hypothetical protein